VARSSARTGNGGPLLMAERHCDVSWGLTRMGKIAVSATCVVLVGGGLAHRALVERIQVALGHVLKLEHPLSTLPLRQGPWVGRDLPTDNRTREIAGDDEFLSRAYHNEQSSRTVDLYVGYKGRPRSTMFHRPEICYVSHGFEQVSERSTIVTSQSGKKIPFTLYEFRSPKIGGSRALVMATYVINGKCSANGAAAEDLNVRSPRLSGAYPVYITRIQVALQASGNPAEDLPILSDFCGKIFEQIAGIMPSFSH
jgi:hypothetical protein